MYKLITIFLILNIINNTSTVVKKPTLKESHEQEKQRIINKVKNAKIANGANTGSFKVLYDDGNSFEELHSLKSSLTISNNGTKKELLLSMGYNNKCICTAKNNTLLTDCNYIKDSRKIYIELDSKSNLLISQFKDLCNSRSFFIFGSQISNYDKKNISSIALINYQNPKKEINMVALSQ